MRAALFHERGLIANRKLIRGSGASTPMESIWGSMQIELLNRKKWMTYVELSTAMADYIATLLRPAAKPQLTRVPHARAFETSMSEDNQAELLQPWANKRGTGHPYHYGGATSPSLALYCQRISA